MTDRREEILSRLITVCQVDGIRKVIRNQLSPGEDILPAVAVLEGDELADETDPVTRPANAPRRVMMTPEIVILLGDLPEDVGTSINTIRAAIIKAVVNDSGLLGLVINNHAIRYLGSATELAYGRTMEATMALKFAFTYVLLPREL